MTYIPLLSAGWVSTVVLFQQYVTPTPTPTPTVTPTPSLSAS